jgi:hypothetical protein
MWWMPWRLQAMKDVAACEKLRGAGKRALIRRYPNGETHPCIDGFQWKLCRRVVCEDKSTSSQTGQWNLKELCRRVVCEDKSRTKSNSSDAGW